LYGDEEQNLPLEYAKALCELFARLGAWGVNVLLATVDDGIGKEDNSGQVQFIPNFPVP
jgi:tripeptidyl-peptidase-1